MSESRVRENRMHGSIGGCWGGDDHGEPEYAPDRETGGTEPGHLPLFAEPVAYLTNDLDGSPDLT
jgi:hypothetical protein